MNFFIIGCGRVGSELAFRLYKNGHKVVVVDKNRDALNGLPPEFRGRTLCGPMRRTALSMRGVRVCRL